MKTYLSIAKGSIAIFIAATSALAISTAIVIQLNQVRMI